MTDAHGMMHLNHMNTRQDTHAAKVYHQSTADPECQHNLATKGVSLKNY